MADQPTSEGESALSPGRRRREPAWTGPEPPELGEPTSNAPNVDSQDESTDERALEEIDVSEVIPEELMEVLREKGPEKAKVILRAAMSTTTTTWQWHVPPPEILAEYNKAYDGCARDLVNMAKAQAKHRQSLESKTVDSDIHARSRGQFFGFLLALVVLGGGLIAIILGKSLAGLSAVILALASLLGLFVYSRRDGTRELQEKMKELDEARGVGGDAFPAGDVDALRRRMERDEREAQLDEISEESALGGTD